MNLKAKAMLAASLALLICSAAAASASAESLSGNPAVRSASSNGSEFMNSLQKQASVWQDELASQPEFAAWNGATLKLEPLGPGGHSWIATLSDSSTGRPVGYMVVHAKPDGGFALGEYGAGDAPLFNTSSLEEGLDKAKLTITSRSKLYVSPAIAVWKLIDKSGKAYYADAGSGEILPIQDKQWTQGAAATALSDVSTADKQPASRNDIAFNFTQTKKTRIASTLLTRPSSVLPKTKIRKAILLKPDDPFRRLAWLANPAMTDSSKKSLLSLMDAGRKMDYSAELFDGAIRLIGQAHGYHNWSDGRSFGAFSIAGAEGTRYWPLEDAAAAGSFYPV